MANIRPEIARMDKFLWAMRLFKTRSEAAQACEKNHILINDREAKPSSTVRIGDLIAVKRPPVYFTYKVLDLTLNRQPAKNVNQFMADLTPENEKDQLKFQKMVAPLQRPRGSGRPTKKDRRDIDDLLSWD